MESGKMALIAERSLTSQSTMKLRVFRPHSSLNHVNHGFRKYLKDVCWYRLGQINLFIWYSLMKTEAHIEYHSLWLGWAKHVCDRNPFVHKSVFYNDGEQKSWLVGFSVLWNGPDVLDYVMCSIHAHNFDVVGHYLWRKRAGISI